MVRKVNSQITDNDLPAGRPVVTSIAILTKNIFLTVFFIHAFFFIHDTNQPRVLYFLLFLTVCLILTEKFMTKFNRLKIPGRFLRFFFNKKNEVYFYGRIFLLTIFTALILPAYGKYFVIQPFVVNQKSMLPEIKPGELILVEKISMGLIINYHDKNNPVRRLNLSWNRPIQVRDVIIFRKPGTLTPPRQNILIKQDILIKRVERIENNKYCVVGDNPENSLDSRAFGCVPENLIIGRYIYKIPFSGFNSTRLPKNIAVKESIQRHSI
jgi:signal peptidase I